MHQKVFPSILTAVRLEFVVIFDIIYPNYCVLKNMLSYFYYSDVARCLKEFKVAIPAPSFLVIPQIKPDPVKTPVRKSQADLLG